MCVKRQRKSQVTWSRKVPVTLDGSDPASKQDVHLGEQARRDV